MTEPQIDFPSQDSITFERLDNDISFISLMRYCGESFSVLLSLQACR